MMKHDEFEAYKSSRITTIKLLAECYDPTQIGAIYNTLKLIWKGILKTDDEEQLFDYYCKECEIIKLITKKGEENKQ